MTSPLKKLLVLGALMWVAPLGAEPRETIAPGDADGGCPYERAAAARAAEAAGKTDAPLFGGHAQSAALLP